MFLSWLGLGLPPRTPRQIEEDRRFMDAIKGLKTLRVYRNEFGTRLSIDPEELQPELENSRNRNRK